jgi:hypothetical protein
MATTVKGCVTSGIGIWLFVLSSLDTRCCVGISLTETAFLLGLIVGVFIFTTNCSLKVVLISEQFKFLT